MLHRITKVENSLWANQSFSRFGAVRPFRFDSFNFSDERISIVRDNMRLFSRFPPNKKKRRKLSNSFSFISLSFCVWELMSIETFVQHDTPTVHEELSVRSFSFVRRNRLTIKIANTRNEFPFLLLRRPKNSNKRTEDNGKVCRRRIKFLSIFLFLFFCCNGFLIVVECLRAISFNTFLSFCLASLLFYFL